MLFRWISEHDSRLVLQSLLSDVCSQAPKDIDVNWVLRSEKPVSHRPTFTGGETLPNRQEFVTS